MTDTRWLTFDCYGTIVDWLTGMGAALTPLVGADDVRLLRAYHRAELAVEGAPAWRPYREVLTEGLRRAAEHEGIALPAGTEDAFVRAWTEMPVYSDVTPALTALRDSGWQLAIITNCDDDMFAATHARLPVAFDPVVTAEQVQSYRPDLGHFRRFAELTGATAANWIHVGTSWVHDVLPATRSGLASIWIDRDRSGHPAALATRRIDDMRTLSTAVAEVAAELGAAS